MKYGLYQSYIENPESFFAPAKPILARKPVKRMKRYRHTPTYAKPVLENDFDFTFDRQEQPVVEASAVTFENSQYESWWLQHKHWKARQQGVVATHITTTTARPQSRHMRVKLVDLSFPAPHQSPKREERPQFLEKKVRTENKDAGINFTYIQPKLKTYLEYLKTPVEAVRPRTHASGTSRQTAMSAEMARRAKSRGANEGNSSRITHGSMTDSDIVPLMNPKISQLFAEAEVEHPKKKKTLEQSLNISPKRINFKQEPIHQLPSRSNRQRSTEMSRYEAGGLPTDTASSVPSPQMTSRLL
mmetsp:Transcript_25735/g.45196  ORF Transcript_25735/g.45196 Transcript_25735/m.45196 type:complete len:301 (-) Transcript_25735:33-935(-)